MTTTVARSASPPLEHAPSRGWLARLGAWSGSHLRVVLVAWLLLLGIFGAFAPQVMSALSGAGWQELVPAEVARTHPAERPLLPLS